MSEAIAAVDASAVDLFKRSGVNVCPHGYVRGAQALASVLGRTDGLRVRSLGWEKPGACPKNILQQTGIICFMRIPGFSGEGHIDLWDKTATVGPNSEYWDSATIWFWKLA